MGFVEMGVQICLPNKKILGTYAWEEGCGFPEAVVAHSFNQLGTIFLVP